MERYVKNFLDILILALLKDTHLCGYDIMATIHNQFHILLSPGTLYPLLYKLEEQGIISGQSNNRKKNYFISEKGLRLYKQLSKNFEISSQNLIKMMKSDSVSGLHSPYEYIVKWLHEGFKNHFTRLGIASKSLKKRAEFFSN